MGSVSIGWRWIKVTSALSIIVVIPNLPGLLKEMLPTVVGHTNVATMDSVQQVQETFVGLLEGLTGVFSTQFLTFCFVTFRGPEAVG